MKEGSPELIVLLVLAALILLPLLIITVSKVCCSVCTIYSEYKRSKLQRHRCASPRSATPSKKSLNSEKLGLINEDIRLERQTGIRIDRYPFIVDYTRIADFGNLLPTNPHRVPLDSKSTDSEISINNSQKLGSDSPGSEPFSDYQRSPALLSDDDDVMSPTNLHSPVLYTVPDASADEAHSSSQTGLLSPQCQSETTTVHISGSSEDPRSFDGEEPHILQSGPSVGTALFPDITHDSNQKNDLSSTSDNGAYI